MNKTRPRAKSKRVLARAARKPVPRPRAAAAMKGGPDVVIAVDAKREGLDAALGAAYLMIDRAYVLVEGDPAKSLRVSLRAKGARTAAARTALAADFRAELAAQRVRWAIARSNQSIREYVAENALTLAAEFAARPEPGAAPAAEELTSDQRAEIERLIAEVETEIKAMNGTKAHPDPKGVAAPWEAGRPEGGRDAA
jgi:His-Xaa-Ser system protein HxsD